MYATLITSRQLYKLTNLKPKTNASWVSSTTEIDGKKITDYKVMNASKSSKNIAPYKYVCPVYTLSFLLDYVKEVLIGEEYCPVQLAYSNIKLTWSAKLRGYGGAVYNETPEDAVARLIMYLYRNDVL